MRILFAEDDKQLRASVTRGLREAGYTVEQAATGAQALGLFEGSSFDAVVLDVLLPEPDGIAVCRTIREMGNRTPILMLTALDAVEHRIAGLDAGADDYLTKPFDFGELLARLRALIRRHHELPAPHLTIADLAIDAQKHRVKRGERDIELTAKEYEFLLHLARNAGRVVTRAELMSSVWDDARNTYSNIIDVYASRLRRKIDEGEEAALFTTVRGVGFMLAVPEVSAALRKGGGRKRA
ncbi:MAG: response regulator transcription factor [Cytophagaceae bacterium]|nr:response regulator transcription factor [Gemmatimonadaceae bacterium]